MKSKKVLSGKVQKVSLKGIMKKMRRKTLLIRS